MRKIDYIIKLYKNSKGVSEVRNYITYLQKNVNKDNRIKSKKIDEYMRLLSINGLSLGEPYIKKIDDNIWELRPLKDRFLFSYKNNNFIILSHFVKKTQKTPKREIKKAYKILKDCKLRKII